MGVRRAWKLRDSGVIQKIIFHPLQPSYLPFHVLEASSKGLFVACSTRLKPFSILTFCLCCSSSGKCNCSKPGNSQGKALLPKPFLGAWWFFQTPYSGGGNGSCHQSTGTCRSDQNKQFGTARRVKGQAQRCCSRPSMGGKLLPALHRDVFGTARAQVEMGGH